MNVKTASLFASSPVIALREQAQKVLAAHARRVERREARKGLGPQFPELSEEELRAQYEG